MIAHTFHLDVVGWGPQQGAGIANVVHYNIGWRVARSLKSLAITWAVALPLMLIPYAVVIVLPAAIALSVFFVVQHMHSPDVATRCTGTCPDCGHEQSFDLPERFELPLEIQCGHCHRELWLREHHDASVATT